MSRRAQKALSGMPRCARRSTPCPVPSRSAASVSTGSAPVTTDPAKAAAKEHVQVPPGADVWDSGFVNTGTTFERTFEIAGEYKYFCIPHELSGMLGTVVVK